MCFLSVLVPMTKTNRMCETSIQQLPIKAPIEIYQGACIGVALAVVQADQQGKWVENTSWIDMTHIPYDVRMMIVS